MKAGDQRKLGALRLLRSSIKNKEIEKGKGKTLSDQELIELIAYSIKQRRESIEMFKQGNRQDLVDKEQQEIEVLKVFLPEQLSREDLVQKAKAAIRESGAAGPKDMGKVMKALVPQVAGRAEGSVVSQIVKELLGSGVKPE